MSASRHLILACALATWQLSCGSSTRALDVDSDLSTDAGPDGSDDGSPDATGGDGGPETGPTPDGGRPDPVCVRGRSEACQCDNGSFGARVCGEDGTWGSCLCSPVGPEDEVERLEWMLATIVGTWEGISRQRDGDHEVEVTFRADLTYSCRCFGDCSAMGWGGNHESPQRIYEINDIRDGGLGHGELTLVWEVETTDWAEMAAVDLSDDGDALSFELYRYLRDIGLQGPVTLELERVEP